MPAPRRRATNGAAKPDRKDKRSYIVVRREGTTLTVLDADVPARKAEEAIDKVVAGMSPQSRNGDIGAFLASSYREQNITTEQTWQTSKTAAKQAETLFAANGPA